MGFRDTTCKKHNVVHDRRNKCWQCHDAEMLSQVSSHALQALVDTAIAKERVEQTATRRFYERVRDIVLERMRDLEPSPTSDHYDSGPGLISGKAAHEIFYPSKDKTDATKFYGLLDWLPEENANKVKPGDTQIDFDFFDGTPFAKPRREDRDTEPMHPIAPRKCECGAEAIKAPTHSTWCPLGKK